MQVLCRFGATRGRDGTTAAASSKQVKQDKSALKTTAVHLFIHHPSSMTKGRQPSFPNSRVNYYFFPFSAGSRLCFVLDTLVRGDFGASAH
jgi:hypothetical protein